ncbi:MAG: alpha/beta hydrolase [Hyphomicrobiales bacterium]|nr:alpha/beta hydrolase [Hyphomicrobiales bacterium]
MALEEAGFVEVAGKRLEYRHFGPQPEEAPTLVLLHEGLGSVGLWLDFPQALQRATGCGVFAWSRAGYGSSDPVDLPRPLDYMQREAEAVLPPLLDAIGFRRGVLVGHSDGASIAAHHLGRIRDRRVEAAVLIAPHFFVEEMCVAAIAEAKIAWETTDLAARLGRWHARPDVAFLGWNGAWLDPDFRHWDIRASLETIGRPMLVIQGADDQYGTLAQPQTAVDLSPAPVRVEILDGVKHSPHREARDATVAAIVRFFTAFPELSVSQTLEVSP